MREWLSSGEYILAYYAIVLLFISEFAIWVYTNLGSKKSWKKMGDQGLIWLIIRAWCWRISAGSFFRQSGMSQIMQRPLFPGESIIWERY